MRAVAVEYLSLLRVKPLHSYTSPACSTGTSRACGKSAATSLSLRIHCVASYKNWKRKYSVSPVVRSWVCRKSLDP